MDELDKRLLRDFEKYTNKQFKNSLNDILPQKLIPTVINLSEIDPEKEVNQITKAERRNLCELLKNFSFTINATRPIEEAIITSGGVKLSDVNPKTMESKLVSKLYFAGELLDLDAFTGGFNLQIAFSTGMSLDFRFSELIVYKITILFINGGFFMCIKNYKYFVILTLVIFLWVVAVQYLLLQPSYAVILNKSLLLEYESFH